MKGNAALIDHLNKNLVDEFSASQQYLLHSYIADNWGYSKLASYLKERSDEEREHATELMDRILFLEGKPVVNKLLNVNTSYDIKQQFDLDLAAELGAVKSYNEAIKKAVEVGDNSTRSLLEEILNDEIKHIDKIEDYQAQIKQLTYQIWLRTQV